MRDRGIEVGQTSASDMEITGEQGIDTKNDSLIFTETDELRNWNWLSTNVNDMSDVDFEAESLGKIDKKRQRARKQSDVVGVELAKQVSGTTEAL
jgi:hypothetical protein